MPSNKFIFFATCNSANSTRAGDMSSPSPVCQNCYARTERRCGVCGTCVYCSSECETVAADQCNSRVACALHNRLEREPTNLGEAALHVRMMGNYATTLTANSDLRAQWHAMCTGAMHYVRLLIGICDSNVYKKSAFGVVCTLTDDYEATGGAQRIRFESGAKLAASQKIAKTMATLALELNGGAPKTRAVIGIGGVDEARSVLHFDAFFICYKDGAWTVEGVVPLWEQVLTRKDGSFYTMSYKLLGATPTSAFHALRDVEAALTPPALAPTPESQNPEGSALPTGRRERARGPDPSPQLPERARLALQAALQAPPPPPRAAVQEPK